MNRWHAFRAVFAPDELSGGGDPIYDDPIADDPIETTIDDLLGLEPEEEEEASSPPISVQDVEEIIGRQLDSRLNALADRLAPPPAAQPKPASPASASSGLNPTQEALAYINLQNTMLEEVRQEYGDLPPAIERQLLSELQQNFTDYQSLSALYSSTKGNHLAIADSLVAKSVRGGSYLPQAFRDRAAPAAAAPSPRSAQGVPQPIRATEKDKAAIARVEQIIQRSHPGFRLTAAAIAECQRHKNRVGEEEMYTVHGR